MTVATAIPKLSTEALEVDISKISVNPFQPRKQFSDQELQELSESIRAVGLIHPPVVRKCPGEDRYELIAGERRLRACQRLGWDQILVVVRASTVCQSAQAALIENVQRIDLNPLEIAESLKSLLSEFGFSQEQLAERVGKKRSTVANYLRLLSLPESIQQSLRNSAISMGHAKVLLSVNSSEKQQLLHELVLRDGLTVRELEKRVKKATPTRKRNAPQHPPRDVYLEQLEEVVTQTLGTKVSIQSAAKEKQKGSIAIDYYSLDDLERILALLGVDGLDR